MFTCDTRRDEMRTVVSARGEIDLTNSAKFWDVLRPLLVPEALVAIDCSEISFIDSQGISVLIQAQRRADAVGAELGLAAPSPTVLRVLDLVGITEMFALTPPADSGPHEPRKSQETH